MDMSYVNQLDVQVEKESILLISVEMIEIQNERKLFH